MNVTSTGIAVALAVVVVLGFFMFGAVNPLATAPASEVAGESVTVPTIQTTSETDSMITDTQVGTGAEVVVGSTVVVHYEGRLTDGTVFDSSIPRGQPFSFTVGAGQVIQGWEQGLLGMKVGGKRTLTIPPELGYGAQAVGGVIPANSTLVFDIELLEVR